MLTHSTRRWLAGLGVAGAFVAASASPALAAPAAEFDMYFEDVTVAADSPGVVRSPSLYSSESTVLNEVSVRYDYGSLAGKIALAGERADECAADGEGVLLCRESFPIAVDELYGGFLGSVVIAPTDKAANGDTGALKISIKAANKQIADYTSRIRIGEGVDLAGGPDTTVTAAPGGKFQAPLTVLNAGTTEVDGVVVMFDSDYGIRTKERFDNCLYVEDFLLACEFDEKIPAGQGVTAALNYELATDTYAPGREYSNAWFMTPADFEDLLGVREEAGAEKARRGTGRTLSLEAVPSKQRRAVQTDTDPNNNFSGLTVDVTGKNGADLEAIGATLTGKKGAVLTVPLGFRNNGPATLDHLRSGSDVTFVDVTVPKGTTAVEVPFECAPRTGNDAEWDEAGTPGAAAYRCYPGPFAPAGEELTGEFTFRIDKVIANATGTVKVNVPCECEGGFYEDLKPANDTAKILVNAAGGQGGGDGGALPITGQSTGLIAGIGALLLAAGVGGFLVAKRRRTRFVA
ncbi:LPXTG cell wall anchor domain-containing protein [Micromonospora orduensis]|uniref:LPXTG cell wall anchor domain-containing protein n=1 Tax=Micromonospora orduensis TaxID=1420891 RepID=A0A5C4QWV7_9ACTN|nr:LPXTG cell wall anchor domain-containing protein [Micromonospora orduensis]TNH30473.1 LPXTG cell wall anchor domain-containing protein [Micromonospora orduensis]